MEGLRSSTTASPRNPSCTSIAPEETSLQTRLATATLKWMTDLYNSESETRTAFATNEPGRIRSGIWYPFHHRKSLDSLGTKATKLKSFFESKKAHILGYADPKLFTTISGTGEKSFDGKQIMHFVLKNGVLPSDAIKAAKTGLSIIDCAVACQIARYGALLEVLGERKFNILFGHTSAGEKMNIGYYIDDDNQPMQYFVGFTEAAMESMIRLNYDKNPEKIVGEVGNRAVKIGQLVEIQGVATHRFKHPWRATAGYNLICSNDSPGQQRFIGLGMEGSEVEIYRQLLIDYNAEFSFDDILPELVTREIQKNVEEYKNHKANSLRLHENEGFNFGSMQDFKLSLIRDLIDLPEESVNMKFVKNHPEQHCQTSEYAKELALKIINEQS